MARKAKPVEKPRPQIGDYVAHDVCGWCIWQMTGPGYWDTKFVGMACETQEGAEQLAALMNAAAKLAARPHLLKANSMYRDTEPKLWALHCLVSAVSRAVGGPHLELFHEYLQRLDHERCEACKPAPISEAA